VTIEHEDIAPDLKHTMLGVSLYNDICYLMAIKKKPCREVAIKILLILRDYFNNKKHNVRRISVCEYRWSTREANVEIVIYGNAAIHGRVLKMHVSDYQLVTWWLNGSYIENRRQYQDSNPINNEALIKSLLPFS
jgi:hypothetical protein